MGKASAVALQWAHLALSFIYCLFETADSYQTQVGMTFFSAICTANLCKVFVLHATDANY